MDIKASINDALNKFNPVGILNTFCKKGATITIPKKPITTEGSAARSSTTGLIISLTFLDAISAIYIAVSTPSGIEIREDNNVTASDAIISDKIPKSGGSEVGYQYSPKIKSLTATSLKIGIPSMKRKIIIMKRIITEAEAMLKNNICIVRSVI
jgi:hypothetical protein